jgi:hypothetical protein
MPRKASIAVRPCLIWDGGIGGLDVRRGGGIDRCFFFQHAAVSSFPFLFVWDFVLCCVSVACPVARRVIRHFEMYRPKKGENANTHLGLLQPLEVGVDAERVALRDDREAKRVPRLAWFFVSVSVECSSG